MDGIYKEKATGGFPPIYICDKLSKKKEKDTDKHFTFDQEKNLANLEELFKIKNEKKTPFIEL